VLTPASALLALTLHLCMRDGACQPLQGSASQTTPQAPAKQPPPAPPSQQPPPEKTSSISTTLEAGEADASTPRDRRMAKWNDFDGKWASIRFGWGLGIDYGGFKQDEASKEQFTLDDEAKLRDFRFLLKGRLKFFGERKVTYTVGIMYDGGNEEWVMRQTGIMVELPKNGGNLFFGRTKEGFSMSKIMVGYEILGVERMPMNDAVVPILADGIKWTGNAPKARLIWNVGVFADFLSEKQNFNNSEHQVVGRLVWLPQLSDEGRGKALHLGIAVRHAKADDGSLRLKSRPESWVAPFFIDTGQFDANDSTATGFEVYYRPGPLLIGGEYFIDQVDAPDSGNPLFHGGEAEVSWLVTGETRPYNSKGGYFERVQPARSVFRGGPGAWEVITRISYADLDDGTLTGGKFWRFTPMVNWHLDTFLRLSFVYGYGSLDRFSTVGKTQFFQLRFLTSY
jgi:phosphate-selective porin OprO and OprP